MSYKYGVELVPSFYHYGGGGLGSPVASIPQSGEAGAGYLANEAADSANAGKEIRGLILTAPSAGVFKVGELSEFTLTGAPDGAYTFTYQVYLDGSDGGIGTGSIIIGGAALNGNASMGAYSVAGTVYISAPVGSGVVIANTNIIGTHMKKNVAGQFIGAQMTYLNGDDYLGSVTVYIKGDGGSMAIGSVGSGLAVNKGRGYFEYAPSQAETNYNHTSYTFTGVGAASVTHQQYMSFPQTSNAPTATENADAVLNRDMAAVADTNSRSILNALRFIRNKWTNSGSTLTVFKEDDVTPAWTAVIASTPGADPVSGVDPV